ncbi:STAS domain-containing protein [Streptomyces sp. NPDC090127]|uniref:STAS domain-containing protein n=1 Tax=Streptomyces sp. NPDC090127 TaxID=3365953 RepID=UPI00380EED9D
MENAFDITVTRYESVLHLVPAGELDGAGRTAFERVQSSVDDGVRVVVCDMGRVPFMDVSGLKCLLSLAERLDALGVALFLVNWRPQPLRLLDLARDVDRTTSNSCAGRPPAPSVALRRSLEAHVREGWKRGMQAAGLDRSVPAVASFCGVPQGTRRRS